MKNQHTNVTGVILAGGLGRRMNHQDKGLVLYNNIPLMHYAITAMLPVVTELFINANRHHAEYRAFGLPIIADQSPDFEGPLAGILTALCHISGEILLVSPCDSPLVQAHHLQKLVTILLETQSEITVAFDGKQLQPVFLALKTTLKNNLDSYLKQGNRKIADWVKQQRFVEVDFSEDNAIFLNLNTLEQLADLEKMQNC